MGKKKSRLKITVVSSIVLCIIGYLTYTGIRDGGSSLQVDYQGLVPDSFKPVKEVIVEGKYTAEGLFKTTTVMPTSPSTYG